MSDNGWKLTKDENPDFKCYQCGSNEVEYRLHESSCGGFEDYHYRCKGCGRDWWVESADA